MNRKILIGAGAVIVVLAGVGAGYWLAMHRMMSPAPSADAAAAQAAGRKPLYWHDPMYPQQKFDKPGKSPFMEMMLVPVYGDEGGNDSSVSISSRVVQNLGMRTAEVTEGPMQSGLQAVGAVAFDERSVAVVQARVNGYVEKLFARAPLDSVQKGQPMAEILAPDWVAAQQEYLALRSSPLANDALRQAARQRLVLTGIPEETIAAVERDGAVRSRVTVNAPISGVISELGAREGMAVMPGAMLFRINGLSTVWVNAEIPESQAGTIKPGTPVSVEVPAYPGEKLAGRVTALLPEVNAATRTVKTRIELANPGGKLKPGMFATVDFKAQERPPVLMVPSEAVIRTGQRNVVIVADTAEDGKQLFRPSDVEVGAEMGGMTEIRKGLARGMKVVTSGQFLVDSEASLKSVETRLGDAPVAEVHRGEGIVEKIGAKEITLSHGPIPSMKWGDMTMDFIAPRSGVPRGLKQGDRVTFEFTPTPKGEFEIIAIAPSKAAK